jgi:hypothetical protein
VVIGSSSFANGLVADTRVYTPISEISPALASDSGAASMQHMAIVKDFLLPDPLVITTNTALAGGNVGTAVSRTFSATGGTSAFNWTLASETVPAGLTLSSGGILSGTPTAAGTFHFTIRLSDPEADPVTKSFTMTIAEPLTVYLESYGLAANSAAVDSDSDGLPNLVEFLLGGNPISASDSIAPVLGFSSDGLRATYDFAVLKLTGSVSWKVESSTDLTLWNPVTNGTNGATITTLSQSPTMNRITVNLPKSATKTFLRVKVKSP